MPTSLPHPVILCSALFSISHAEHPSPVSEYVVTCDKRVSVSSRVFRLFVLFLHTISFINRHLALYHFQVAISEIESFESITYTQDFTCYLSVNSEPTVAEPMYMPHGRQI